MLEAAGFFDVIPFFLLQQQSAPNLPASEAPTGITFQIIVDIASI